MSTVHSTTQYLVDHLRSQLSASPVTHPLTITVVESRPKNTTALFPYVEDSPKVRVQQVLVTVSADVELRNGESGEHGEGTRDDDGAADVTNDSQDHQTALDTSIHPERLLICALEAYVYHVPSTSSCLVYLSKVDSTGYSPASSAAPRGELSTSSPSNSARLPPTTYFLLKAFLSYYHPVPSTRSRQIQRPYHHKHVYVSLFARSANQYLFPNSILGGGKKVLGGVKLCKWWRRVFEDIIVDLEKENGAGKDTSTQESEFRSYLTYFLPSYDQLEARSLIGIPPTSNQAPDTGQSLRTVDWQYLPPGDPSLNSLLFPPDTTPTAENTPHSDHERKSRSLGMLVPTFDDDPKARFLVELVINNPVGKMRTGKMKRQGQHEDTQGDGSRKRQRLQENGRADDGCEASAGAEDVVDALQPDGTSTSSAIKDIKDKRRNDERRLRQEDAAALATISWDNFWTRMGYRQECISGDVTGFFSMYVGLSPSSTAAPPTERVAQEDEEQPTGEGPHQVSHPLFSRIAAALLNHDFANRTLAIDATRRFLGQTENIVVAEIGKELWDSRCVARVERNDKGRVFQQSKTGTGTASGNAGAVGASQPVVNVLQVKKKKKPVK